MLKTDKISKTEDSMDYAEIAESLRGMRSSMLREVREKRETSTDPAGTISLCAARSMSAKLLQVSDALNRIRHGVYGACKACQDPIPLERLRRHPLARYCIDCQDDR